MKRFLSVMLSIMLCMSCISVGTTTAFADNTNTYTPVVKLTPDMYTPKTVYVDDDFNNRVTDLSTIAEGQTAYDHQVIMKANDKTATTYGLGSDETDTYAQVSGTYKSMGLLDYNNKNVDKINVSFRFRFPTYKGGMYFLVNATQAGGTVNKPILKFIGTSTDENKYAIYYYKAGDTKAYWAANLTTQGTNTWNRVSFQLERVADAENPGSYNVYIRKIVYTDENGNITKINTSSLSPVDADWWSGSVTDSTIADASNIALRIKDNNTTDLCIDDVMVYEPEDLKMSDAQYDSTSGNVKAVFTRGLNKDTLSGITLKKGDTDITSAVALDTADTSNRTVIITPTETIDTTNNSYTVTATGVQDGTEGEAVPTQSVTLGSTTGEPTDPVDPVDPVEPTEKGESVVQLKPNMYTPKTVYVDDDFNNRDTDFSTIASGKTAYDHQITTTNTSFILGSDDTNLCAVPTGTYKSLVVKDVNDVDADKIAMSLKFKFEETGKLFQIYVSNSAGDSTKFLSIQLLSGNKCEVKYNSSSGSMTNVYGSNFATQGTGTWNNIDFELERTLADGAYTVKMNRLCVTDSLGNSTNLDTSDKEIISLDWWSGAATNSSAAKAAIRICQNSTTNLCIDDVMLYEPEEFKLSKAYYDAEAYKGKIEFTCGIDKSTLGGVEVYKGTKKVSVTVALDTSDSTGRTATIVPNEPIDLDNQTYTLKVSNVKDVNGSTVQESSIYFGKKSIIAENAKYYITEGVTDTELIGKAEAGQTVTAKVDINNITDDDTVIMPVIAYYEGKILKCVNSGANVPIEAGKSGQVSVSLTMPNTLGENGKFRFFAFRDNMVIPVMSSLDKFNVELPEANLFLVGDSVCASYQNANQYPQTGWGDRIGTLLSDKITVNNFAHGGFSTRSYMVYDEYSANYGTHTWNGETVVNKDGVTKTAIPILPQISEGDYVIVSLGINDNSSTESVHTDEATYKGYLKQMAEDTKEKGAEMIFVTPTITVSGKLTDEDKFQWALSNNYSERGTWMKEVAEECGVVCLDLGTTMYEYYKEISDGGDFDTIRKYHLYRKFLLMSSEEGGFGLTEEELANHANTTISGGNNDGTHLSTEGAYMVANLIVDLMGDSDSSLRYYIEK